MDYAVSDVFIDKFASAMLSKSVESYYIAGPWEVVTIIIQVMDYFYEKYMPSAKDITRYFLLYGFVSSVESGLLTMRQDMMSTLASGKQISRQTISDYEFLYNTKIKTMKMYMDAAYDITKSSMFSSEKTNLLQVRINAIADTLENEYDYDYYVDLCARQATGETISDADFPITYTVCTVVQNESIDLYRDGNLQYKERL